MLLIVTKRDRVVLPPCPTELLPAIGIERGPGCMWSCTSSAARCSDVQNHAALLQAQAVPGGCLSFLLQAMLEARKMASSLLFIESRQQAVKADFHLPGAEPFKSLGLFGHRVHRFKPVPSADFRSQQGKQAWWRRQELAGVGSGRLVPWGVFCG